ncbi:hypothetical protein OCA13_25725 [Bacillus cereus]|nr:hypothetical protein [Bacillus cereus]
MKSQKELIYHFREFWDFEYICLETKGLGFPELEEVMLKYHMYKSDENLKSVGYIVNLWMEKN